jgi:hypothetical protein
VFLLVFVFGVYFCLCFLFLGCYVSEELKMKSVALEIVRIAKSLVSYPEQKLVGRGFRLTWGTNGLGLQELHAKGLRQLRLLSVSVWSGGFFRVFNVENFVDRVNDNMSYDQAKASILKRIEEMKVEEVKLGTEPNVMMGHAANVHETKVSALKVEPEGMDPVTVEAKNFTVESKWSSFRVYSPDSDMGHSGDPHYTVIESKSAGAARKLYKLLRQNPDALKTVSWDTFTSWLDRNGVSYEYHFSQWN